MTGDTRGSQTSITLAGRYRLDSRIAVGGMGEVWQARDLLLDRDVAIKLLKAEYLEDPGFLARFQAEARHTAGLSHPGIATVYDFAEVNGAPFLVLELVRGEPLSALLARAGALPVGQSLDIAAQTARALGAAHAAGVIHRDVKPGNILVCPDGVVKVTDFGIARAIDAVSLTQTGTVLGTANYLSPEQAAGAVTVPASDLYSLGVVTYEMVAGSLPFRARNPVALALAHLREKPEPLPADVPEPVRALILRALEKKPADRYADAAAFASAAEHAAAVTGGLLPPGALPMSTVVVGARGDATRVLPAAGGFAPRAPSSRRLPLRWVVFAAVPLLLLVALLTNNRAAGPQPSPSQSPSPSPSPATIPVPANLVGMAYEQAAAAVTAVGLTPEPQAVAGPGAAGTVVRTEPPAGTPMLPGAAVTLVTSTGQAPAQSPAVQPPRSENGHGKKKGNDGGG